MLEALFISFKNQTVSLFFYLAKKRKHGSFLDCICGKHECMYVCMDVYRGHTCDREDSWLITRPSWVSYPCSWWYHQWLQFHWYTLSLYMCLLSLQRVKCTVSCNSFLRGWLRYSYAWLFVTILLNLNWDFKFRAAGADFRFVMLIFCRLQDYVLVVTVGTSFQIWFWNWSRATLLCFLGSRCSYLLCMWLSLWIAAVFIHDYKFTNDLT